MPWVPLRVLGGALLLGSKKPNLLQILLGGQRCIHTYDMLPPAHHASRGLQQEPPLITCLINLQTSFRVFNSGARFKMLLVFEKVLSCPLHPVCMCV